MTVFNLPQDLLPGERRVRNQAEDGVLLRVDLHRLLDRGLAELRKGRYWIAERARVDDYADFHNREFGPR